MSKKITSSQILLTVVIVFVAIYIIIFTPKFGGNINSNNTETKDIESSSVSKAYSELTSPALHRPVDEERFIEILQKAKDVYNSGSNDMQKGVSRPNRSVKICSQFTNKNISNWIGVIDTLSTNSEGKGILSINISNGISLGTWNNSFSDIFDNTLIDPLSELFKTSSLLAKSQVVRFSGTFSSSELDCFKESSLTLSGSILNPEFVMKFSVVNPVK